MTAPGTDTRVVDLSFPIDSHFRWSSSLQTVESLADGDAFQTSTFTMSCHAFTHADAPAHVQAGGATLEQVDVGRWVGEACVLDLTSCLEQQPIGAEAFEAAGRHVRPGDIVLLRTDWDLRSDINTLGYWRSAPFIDVSAAEWLLSRGASCVGFDFPQDRAIRDAVQGAHPAPPEFTTHHLLLRHGVGLLEYLRNLHQLRRDRVFVVAAPINLAGADGGPTRAIALEL